MPTLIVALLAVQQRTATPTTPAPDSGPVRPPAATSANMETRVADRAGAPARNMRVVENCTGGSERCQDRAGARGHKIAQYPAGLRSPWLGGGTRMHGVEPLFSWMIPQFDRDRFNASNPSA